MTPIKAENLDSHHIDQIFNSRDGMIDKYNVENVEGDDKFVEMDVALVKVNTSKQVLR